MCAVASSPVWVRFDPGRTEPVCFKESTSMESSLCIVCMYSVWGESVWGEIRYQRYIMDATLLPRQRRRRKDGHPSSNGAKVASFPGSLGTRPSKNRKGGSGTSAGVEVYTAPDMKAHFRLAFD